MLFDADDKEVERINLVTEANTIEKLHALMESKGFTRRLSEAEADSTEGLTKGAHAGLSGACVDGHDKCAEWAMKGECDANPSYMKVTCAKSCGACTEEPKQEL